jgi:hypothetical protein
MTNKPILLIIAAAALLLVGCGKEMTCVNTMTYYSYEIGPLDPIHLRYDSSSVREYSVFTPQEHDAMRELDGVAVSTGTQLIKYKVRCHY